MAAATELSPPQSVNGWVKTRRCIHTHTRLYIYIGIMIHVVYSVHIKCVHNFIDS